MVTPVPLEVESISFALVRAQFDTGRRFAAWPGREVAAEAAVKQTDNQRAFDRHVGTVGQVILVVTVQCGHGKVVGDMPIVAHNDVVTAPRLGCSTGFRAASFALEIVVVLREYTFPRVGERGNSERMVIGDIPEQVCTPEVIVDFTMVEGFRCAQAVVFLGAILQLVQCVEKQAVLDDGSARIDISGPATARVGSIRIVKYAVVENRVRRVARNARGFEIADNSAVEFVAAGLGYGIQHAAGRATELRAIATGFHLELVVEFKRHRAAAKTVAKIGDVHAIDEIGVLGDGRAIERDQRLFLTEGGIAKHGAGRE